MYAKRCKFVSSKDSYLRYQMKRREDYFMFYNSYMAGKMEKIKDRDLRSGRTYPHKAFSQKKTAVNCGGTPK